MQTPSRTTQGAKSHSIPLRALSPIRLCASVPVRENSPSLRSSIILNKINSMPPRKKTIDNTAQTCIIDSIVVIH